MTLLTQGPARWGDPGLTWGMEGLVWGGGIPADKYTNLITSEHADKPKFMAFVAALTKTMVDGQDVLLDMLDKFDIDIAIGDQLDILGLWIGQSRFLSVPLPNVYFSFATAGLGFGQGVWFGPFDPLTGLQRLDDDSYRSLLRAKIAANHWDGTIPGAYKFLEPVFPGRVLAIQDNGDMSMTIGLVGNTPLNAVLVALLTGGYLDVRPAGVSIDHYVEPSVSGAPFFGFGVDTATVSGFGIGSFAKPIGE